MSGTQGYIIRKLVAVIPIMLGVVTLVFLVIHLAPGDPVRQMLPPDAGDEDVARVRHDLGLDRPLPVQYLAYLGRVAVGDLGRSFRSRRPVTAEIAARYPYTVELALAAVILSTLLGIPVGILSAARRYSLFDNTTMAVTFFGVSIPSFALGTFLILFFCLALRWFPPSGRGGPLWTIEGLRRMFLPAMTLAIGSAAGIARLTRSSMLEVMNQDYMRTARAKGLGERAILARHGLRNAVLPVVTFTGLEFGSLLGGAVISETIFSWPGIGRLAVDAIFFRDYPLIQGIVLFYAGGVVLVNLAVDILYCLFDPRISHA